MTSRITEIEVRRNLASAARAGASTIVLTFDIRQAAMARSIGLSVVGC